MATNAEDQRMQRGSATRKDAAKAKNTAPGRSNGVDINPTIHGRTGFNDLKSDICRQLHSQVL
jgi:hypothetical protein